MHPWTQSISRTNVKNQNVFQSSSSVSDPISIFHVSAVSRHLVQRNADSERHKETGGKNLSIDRSLLESICKFPPLSIAAVDPCALFPFFSFHPHLFSFPRSPGSLFHVPSATGAAEWQSLLLQRKGMDWRKADLTLRFLGIKKIIIQASTKESLIMRCCQSTLLYLPHLICYFRKDFWCQHWLTLSDLFAPCAQRVIWLWLRKQLKQICAF